MTKSKENKIDLTVANIAVFNIASNNKQLLIDNNKLEGTVFTDVIEATSACSHYDYKERGAVTHMKGQLEGKNLNGSAEAGKVYLTKLFYCSNNKITRELVGDNQTIKQVKKTLENAEITSRYLLEQYIKAIKAEDKAEAEAEEVETEAEEAEEVIEVTDAEFIAEISKQLKARNFKSLSPLKTLQADIQELQKSLLDTGFKDTIKKVA